MLSYKFNYSLTEIDNLLPYEKQIYTDLLIEQIKKEQEEAEKQNKGY